MRSLKNSLSGGGESCGKQPVGSSKEHCAEKQDQKIPRTGPKPQQRNEFDVEAVML